MFSSEASGRAILREACPGDDKFRKTGDGLLVDNRTKFSRINYIVIL
jgi:hypothetical protein